MTIGCPRQATRTERTLVAVGTVTRRSMPAPRRGAAQDRVGRLVLRRGRLGGLGLLGDRAGHALGRLRGLGVGAGLATGAGFAARARPGGLGFGGLGLDGLGSAGLASASFAAGAFAVVLAPLAEAGAGVGAGFGASPGRVRAVARRRGLEIRDPDRVDALGVALVLVEHLLDQPLVGPEVAGGLAKGLVGLAAKKARTAGFASSSDACE